MSKDKAAAGSDAQADENLAAAQEALEDGIDQAHRYLKRQWTERPLAVAATAIGVGVLLGLLIGGGRR